MDQEKRHSKRHSTEPMANAAEADGSTASASSLGRIMGPPTSGSPESTLENPGELAFKVGQKAVYPSQGIAEIVDIEAKEIHGRVQHFFVLILAESGLRILVPVDKAETVGLRPVAGREDIEEVMEILRERDTPLDRHTWNRRYRGFMDKIKSGSLFEIAEVYRDLNRLRGTKPLSFGERRMLDTARGLIVKEMSAARGEDERQIAELIDVAVRSADADSGSDIP